MTPNDPLNNLTPREAAKLSDLATKGMGHQMGRQVNLGKDVPGGNQASPEDHQVVQDLNQDAINRANVLNPITPSVQSNDQAVKAAPAETDPDAVDVDMFARGNVDRVVDELRAEKEEAQSRAVAEKAKLPFVRLLGYPISPEVLAVIPRELAMQGQLVAYLRAGNKVRVGVLNPANPETTKALDVLKQQLPFDFIMAVIGQDSFRYALKLYDEIPRQTERHGAEIGTESRQEIEREIRTIQDLADRVSQVPTTKMVDLLLTGAVKVGASDIHIEPGEKNIIVRYRLDGILQPVVTLPAGTMNALVNRLKFLSKLKLDLNRLPQDGRFSLKDADGSATHEIDVRVATIPVQFGEAITMRLLDRDTIKLSFDKLGLTGLSRQLVVSAMKRPQGLILECGPTGSGKTTTLYGLLSMLNDPGKKLITLEDPIEYRLEGGPAISSAAGKRLRLWRGIPVGTATRSRCGDGR